VTDAAEPASNTATPGDAGDGVGWLSRSSLKLHATLLLGVALCVYATQFEWFRAREGHQIAWAYVFEWPLFAVMGVYLWWTLLHADRTGQQPRRSAESLAPEDAGLEAWQEYLRRLHSVDPPGGPPDSGHD